MSFLKGLALTFLSLLLFLSLVLFGQAQTLNMTLLNADFAAVQDDLLSIDAVKDVEQQDAAENGALHLKLVCRPGTDPRETVYNNIKKTDWVMVEFYPETQTLETVFRELTKEN